MLCTTKSLSSVEFEWNINSYNLISDLLFYKKRNQQHSFRSTKTVLHINTKNDFFAALILMIPFSFLDLMTSNV
jgi:hypothetical protein